ncbi:MAG: tRNA pseudouridine(13) synthase TruD [Candidatus Altiarchaeota archaeon]
MKLRQRVDDFQVEEINKFEILENSSTKAKYKIYLLEKRGLETFFVLKYLSRNNKIPLSEFKIAGLKDRHAITKQYLTIPSKYELKNLDERNLKLTFLGYVEKPIKIGLLKGNKFMITVRDIKNEELKAIEENANDVKKCGFVNYFGSQRFGSVIHGKFIAKFIMKKNYEEAVKIFLTSYTKHENRKRKEEKRKIAKKWNEIKTLKTENKLFSEILEEYRKTESWLLAYKKIPKNLREIFVSAYQSYLWNECVKLILKRCIDNRKLYTSKYSLGELIFYRNLTPNEIRKIPRTFKMLSHNVKLTDFEKEIVEEVLSSEGIRIKDFDIQKETGNFFKLYDREIVAMPENFEISEAQVDEINDRWKKRRFKVTLSFILKKGSYATVLLQRIFNR